jgi:hypothetical protein
LIQRPCKVFSTIQRPFSLFSSKMMQMDTWFYCVIGQQLDDINSMLNSIWRPSILLMLFASLSSLLAASVIEGFPDEREIICTVNDPVRWTLVFALLPLPSCPAHQSYWWNTSFPIIAVTGRIRGRISFIQLSDRDAVILDAWIFYVPDARSSKLHLISCFSI